VLKIDEALNLAPEPETTIWVGDPAVDREKSDVARWAETADKGALIVRPGEQATGIKFRALDEIELGALRSIDESEHRFIAAAAMGLVEIKGVELRFSSVPIIGVRYVCSEQMRLLELGQRARFVLGPALNRWSAAELGREILKGKALEAEDSVGLMTWLGVQILARSFRRRG